MQRRQFLTAAACAATLGARRARSLAPQSAFAPRIGLQLYTVIAELERDFEGTLRAIADIGYREVETMGSFGRDAAYVRQVLDQYGLASPSQHVVSGDLYDIVRRSVQGQLSGVETRRRLAEGMTTRRIAGLIEEGIATAKILGQRNVVWPAFWPSQMDSREALRQLCTAFNRAGDTCIKADLTFGLHNHGDELRSVNGRIPYDVVLQETEPGAVKLEMDVYWMIWGKKDPVEYLQRHGGRYTQLHLKDARSDGGFSPMGAGTIPFQPILAAARGVGVQHYYVEQNSPADPIAAVRQSFAYLSSRL
jgi:sugar phosphate isomerase/epimerase